LKQRVIFGAFLLSRLCVLISFNIHTMFTSCKHSVDMAL
jgi:hypothetical protein